MTYNTDTEFLSKKFGKEIADDSSFRSSWTSLLHTYDLTTEQLHSKWEAWDIANNSVDRSASMDILGPKTIGRKDTETAVKSLENLRDSLQRDTEKRASMNDSFSNSSTMTPISSQKKRPFTPKLGGSKLDSVLGGIGLGSLTKSKVTSSAQKRPFGNSAFGSPIGNGSDLRDSHGTPTKAIKIEPDTISPLKGQLFDATDDMMGEDLLIGGEELIHKNASAVSKGTVSSVLNPEIPEINNSENQLPKPSVRPNVNLNKFEYRQMRDTLSSSSSYLNEKLSQVRDLIQTSYGISGHEFGDPSVTSQSEIVVVGRIITDSITNTDVDYNDPANGFSHLGGPEEKLGPTVFMICESSISKGRKVEIRMSAELSSRTTLLEEYDDGSNRDDMSLNVPHFFPGQIVVARGRNANGSYFVVSELLQIPYLPPTATFESTLRKWYPANSNTTPVSSSTTTTASGLKIVFASGPYTSPSNLTYEPLLDFVNVMNSSVKPSAIVLFGPFVDITHSKIIAGDFELRDIYPQYYYDSKSKIKLERHELLRNKDKVLANGTLDDIFRVCVLPKLLALVDANPEIQIVLVPHVNDAIARATSFPQAPFINKQKLNGLGKSRRGGLKTGPKNNERRSVSFADLGNASPSGTNGESQQQFTSSSQSEEQYAKKLGLLNVKNVHCVSNPCTFSINEVTITACSQDSLFDILKNTHTPKPVNSTERLRLALSDMLRQRTVYPLLPGFIHNKLWSSSEVKNEETQSNNDTNSGNKIKQIQMCSSASLSIPHLNLAQFPDALPDILVTPSRLQPTAQIIHQVVVLNPGSVAKMGRSGDYSIVSVGAPEFNKDGSHDNIDGDKLVNHEIYKRARIEIVKVK